MNRKRTTRRTFLKGAALGAASVAIQPILSFNRVAHSATGNPGKFLVVINMLGGNDGLNTVIPAHLAPYVDRRPAINLVNDTDNGGGRPVGSPLLDLDGNFKLHYNLGSLKSLWDDGDLHIVDKVSYPNPNQSHFTSQDIYSFGIRDNESNGDGRGWLGRLADAYCADPVEPLGVISVGLGKRPDFSSDVTSPLILSSVESFQVNADSEFRNDHALRERVVREALASDPVPAGEPGFTIFDTSKQAYELVDRVQQETAGWTDPGTYPNTTLGRYLRTCSQLLSAQSSFGTKVLYTGYGGFDTHSGEVARHASLMAQLSAAVGAFADDMKANNKWNNCVIVVISEFGRRVFENGSIGTDHGHGGAFVVMGGQVKGRLDVGSGMTAPLVETDIQTNNTVPFEVDFRDIYGSIAQNHLGLDPAPLFPDPNYTPDHTNLSIV